MNLFGVVTISGVSFFMLCLFAIAAVGYALGRITIKGINLGTAGVFVVALLFGCFCYPMLDAQLQSGGVSYTNNALKIVDTLGLILFVSAVGFIAGPNFFAGLKKNFKSYITLGAVIILSGALVCVLCIVLFKCQPEMAAGLLAGALTSTPALSAARETAGPEMESIVSVGYGIAYLFGVVGVVLFVQLIPKLTKANMEEERAKIQVASSGAREQKEVKGLIALDNMGIGAYALAVVIGVLVGSIKIPMGSSSFSLGNTGGILLTALVVAHFGRIGKLSMKVEKKILEVFRELGLVFFLMGAGISGGANFVKYFNPLYLVYGALMTTIPMFVGYIFAKKVLKLSLFNNLGSITGGMTSTPALGTLINVAKTDDVASAYAATYPVALVLVVLVSQFVIMLF